jgi:ATP-dependent helicase HrpB
MGTVPSSPMLTPLPIDQHLAAVAAALVRHRAAVLVAAPGAGKTTRVPPALAARGRVLLLQPRRVAVRSVARRIADERGWTLGRDIGWHIRFERRFDPDTPLVVVTEGILTARLQQDPFLADVSTVILDEFHERSVHADLGLALARQAWRARDDLHLLVMSATLDAAPIARYLHDCPVIDVAGTLHPLTTEYAPGEDVVTAVRTVWPRSRGQVLCFLPGAREIAQAQAALTGDLRAEVSAAGPSGSPRRSVPGSDPIEVVPLHGSLDGDAQDAALRPATRRRVILATNIAETSLTVPGVDAVVDSGLVKVARYDAARGIDALVTERVTADSADQRAGRAARLGPGLVRRLWEARDRLRPQREPDLARIDLAGPALDVLAWGANPWTFEWFEPPPEPGLEAALGLLARLGAVSGDPRAPQLTALGRRLQRLPLHPRLARILVAGDGAWDAAAVCALLSDGGPRLTDGTVTTSCDLLAALDRFDAAPPHLRQLARDLQRAAGDTSGRSRLSEVDVRRAIHAGYPDRLARRRAGSRDRVVLASGHGAGLGRESGVREAEFLVALDVTAATRAGAAEARIRLASAVEPDWIAPTSVVTEHRLDPATGVVRAWTVGRVDALVVSEQPTTLDPEATTALLVEAWLARPADDATRVLRCRLTFAGLDLDLATLVRAAAAGVDRLDAIDPAAHLPFDVRSSIATTAASWRR